MTTNELRLAEANVAYIGKGVTIKGEINAPDVSSSSLCAS
jgi:hypothetical protein